LGSGDPFVSDEQFKLFDDLSVKRRSMLVAFLETSFLRRLDRKPQSERPPKDGFRRALELIGYGFQHVRFR
jgi:hypothetical protein